MRNLLVLIIVGAAGYYGWQAYQKDPQVFAKYIPGNKTEETASADGSSESSASDEGTASVAPAPAAPTPPVFTSRITVPTPSEGEKKPLPPGQFLVIERAKVETKDGIVAIVPGDMVKLVARRNNGTLEVTNGQNDFVVKESQVTQDVTVAKDAERREFEKRYGPAR